jgi:hypothetical protein
VKNAGPLRLAAMLAAGCVACASSSGSPTGTEEASPLDAAHDAPPFRFDAACGNIETDPLNCGGCGIQCQGGLCVDGLCSAPLPGVLASGQVTPTGIVVDDTNVYWIDQGMQQSSGTYTNAQVMKCAKSGCANAPAVLASGSWNHTTRLAISGGTLYWAAPNLVLACPTTGCTGGATVLSTSPLAPTDIAVDETGIYVGDSIQNALLTFPLAGGMGPTVLWMSSVAPSAVAVDGPTAYFGTAGVSLLTCGTTGCTSLVLGGDPTAVDVAGGVVYIGTQAEQAPGAIASCPEAHCAAGSTILTTGLSHCAGIAVDSTNIYFTDLGTTGADGGTIFSGSGDVEKCPISGCSEKPTPIAAFVNFPQQIAVDDASVYWTDFGSSTDPTATQDGRVMSALK